MTEHLDRKFIWAEISYFQLWWETHATQERKDKFIRLLESGRIEFNNGGWVMHDEAIPTYTACIDQQTLGHQYIMVKLIFSTKIELIFPLGAIW